LTVCRRVRETAPQARLEARDRHKNLRNAFSAKARINYRSIAILDDVVTTGTTVNELARTLLNAGAERIEVWACARAIR
jgi:predicted amidophosphoribosyltransferase